MAAPRTFASKLGAFWASSTGPQTTHFWGPVANWGFVIAVRAHLEMHTMQPAQTALS